MVLIVLFLIFLIASTGETRPPFAYDHLIFVQSWPFGYCATTVCKQLATHQLQMFTVHGLWPVTANGFMESCNGRGSQELDYKSLGETADRYLRLLWPSLSAKFNRDEDFWDSEWNQHGSCTNITFHDYFLYAISLREKVDLQGALEENNIREGGSYKISAIKDAISRRNKFIGGEDRVVLQCVEMKRVYILTEVFLCLGEQGDFVACNRHVRSLENCGIMNVQFLEALVPGDDGESIARSSSGGLQLQIAAACTFMLYLVILMLLFV